ncbi:hypothetical protein EB118_19160 [bacterium]|nr:hypothetical protein [bacterium]NDD83687.1 hypothetical protein [bacterium]NDG32182.1 hypothetical protein [bacterium]
MLPLSVYYCIDLPDSHDTALIEKCLKTHIIVTQKDFQLINFVRYVKKSGKNEDVVKNGLYTLNKMYMDLKLKEQTSTWFFYISNGNIKNVYKNVCAILLNKDPCNKTCLYSIHKTPLVIDKQAEKNSKLSSIFDLNKSLYELFATTNTINYENFM